MSKHAFMKDKNTEVLTSDTSGNEGMCQHTRLTLVLKENACLNPKTYEHAPRRSHLKVFVKMKANR